MVRKNKSSRSYLISESQVTKDIRVKSKDSSCDHIKSRNRSPVKSDKRRIKKSYPRNNLEKSGSNETKRNRRSSQDSSVGSDLQQDSLERSWEKKPTRSYDNRRRRRDSAGESQYSSWSSDETYHEQYNEGIESSNRKRRDRSKAKSSRSPPKPSSPTRQPSPTSRSSPPQERKSPTRVKSPTRRRDEVRRRDSWAGPSDKPGLMLTAEQLKNQKQRLRPVRPSALPDISDLPEKSLQDLTVLLRKAMNIRRDYFPKSIPSDDPFSDWQ